MGSRETYEVRRRIDDDRYSRGKHVWDVIEEYQPRSETYALRYGHLSLAIPAIYTGYKTQRFFNRSFKLGKKMYFTYLPVTILPSLATSLFHKYIVAEEIFSEKYSCQICQEFVCATAHTMSASLWTFILSGSAACMMGSLKKSIYVPPLNKYPLQTLKLIGQKYKQFGPLALVLLLANFAYALLLTDFELREYEHIKARLLTRLELAKRQRYERIETRFDIDAV